MSYVVFGNKLERYLVSVSQSFELISSDDVIVSSVATRAFATDLTQIFSVVNVYMSWVRGNKPYKVNEELGEDFWPQDVYKDEIDSELLSNMDEFVFMCQFHNKYYDSRHLKNMMEFYQLIKPSLERQLELIKSKA